MTKVTVNRATHINLIYSGQGKFTVTWRDFASQIVRRTINLTSWNDTEVAALEAAQLFVDWCNVGLVERGATYTQELETVTLSSIDADRSAVAFTMYSVETADEVAA